MKQSPNSARRDPAIRDRATGALLGLAVGDALGATLEFTRRDSRPFHSEMTGGGPFALKPGEWTDDTAMALALADSLIACRRFVADDVMTRFLAWWREGRYSCTGRCFDIGRTTAAALARFEATGQPFAGSKDENEAGNGSLMRLAPVALFHLQDAVAADQLARDQSRLTHAAPQAIEACAIFVAMLRSAIRGEAEPLRPPLFAAHPALAGVAAGSFAVRRRDDIRSSGYVVDTLEAALWAVARTRSFEEALLLAVNLGGDADTVGAVTGQLAGAIHGASAIPRRWLGPLRWRSKMRRMTDALLTAVPEGPA